MDLVEVAGDAEVRQRHPWEIARSRFFVEVLARQGDLGIERVLDVGAGDAWFAGQLALRFPAYHQVVCWDINYPKDIGEDCREPTADPRISRTAEQPGGRYDLILLLDVLEHVKDAGQFLTGLAETSLASGGHCLVSVPAHQRLYTAHDEMLHHFRRYSMPLLLQTVERAGLDVVVCGGVFHSLLVVRALQKARETVVGPRIQSGIGAWNQSEARSRAMQRWLGAENRLSLMVAERVRRTLPGLSYWALCRQRDAP